MNSLIESIFENFKVGKETIPVSFLFYEGKSNKYVTYQQVNADKSYSADDELQGYVDYYDFDVYCKGNLTAIVSAVRSILEENDFIWQPSRSSDDMYERDTGLYHKTLNFAYLKQEV